MIDLLKQNIEKEKQIVQKISSVYDRFESLSMDKDQDEQEYGNLIKTLPSLVSQLAILNRAIPDLINNISFYKDLKNNESNKLKETKNLISISYKEEGKKETNLAVKKSDKDQFLKHLTVEASNFGQSNQNYSRYIRLANRFFRETSNNLIDKGYFDILKEDLKKITSPLIVSSYVSIMFLSTALSFAFSIVLFLILSLFGFISYAIIILILIPALVFVSFYIYPSSKRKTLEKEINQELPFATIYMSAIALSGLEPSMIFKIIATSDDYPYIRREVKKLTNYVNFYGYDLVSALRYSSKTCPSERLSLLFNGLATAITSGGELNAFLNKHADTLLFDYRLEREKYTRIAETFMDIYISIVVAAPMIMTMLFVLIGLTGFSGLSFSPTFIGIIMSGIIGFLNIFFILFLNIKQPKF